jgi:arylsulfatase A-like enzyme
MTDLQGSSAVLQSARSGARPDRAFVGGGKRIMPHRASRGIWDESMCLVRCLFVLVAAAVPCRFSAAAEARPPNVVFFLVDDLGWRDLGCYGSTFHETPRIDQFARQSMRFTQAYAACHVCSPSRASIMTGKYPARLHLTDWLPGRKDFPFQKLKNAGIHAQLPLEEVTIGEVLKKHGYRTAHIGKWHLGEEPYGPKAQGFDVQIPSWNKGWPKVGYRAPFQLEGLPDSPGEYLTDRLTDEAVRFIEHNRSRPFFLYLSHFAVHDPIQGPAKLVKKYEARLLRAEITDSHLPFLLEGNPDDAHNRSAAELNALLDDERYRDFKVLPDRMVKIKQVQDNVQFAAMVESVDESFGRVIARLKELELDRETIVVFTSDNGGMSAANFGNPARVVAPTKLDAAYSTSNLPLRGGKGWLYEGGIRVPLLVKWPGKGRAGICDFPVISVDFFPSILEMAGIAAEQKPESDGISFAPLLAGARELQREAIYWHFPHYSNHGMQSPGGAIRRGDYKLIEYFENGTVQLFNLHTDPGELHDLAKAEPQQAAALRSMLHAWRKSLDATIMAPNPDYSGGAAK